jgi:HlyD family secretion protein
VHNLKRIHITAPIDGLVVMQPIWRSGQFGQVQEGDQVFPGTYFMQIVDLSKMVVNGWVNQTDSQGLVLGQKATMHLDAYPDLALPGHLTAMGALAGTGARGGRSSRDLWVRMISLRFAVDVKDSRLIPDLSASADVIFKRQDRALQIPREAVVTENGKTYAQVHRGESVEKREIQLGPHNVTQAIVLGGLNEGDEVVIP